jgi:putative Mg2+ transporter-C (MgtC) family protein
MTWWEVVIRIVASMIIGGAIGAQREYKGNAAGLRTHTLVAIGACMAMLTNEFLFRKYVGQTSMDIARMGSYVLTGIGFLGAGSIIKDGFHVRGLTTAAGLWVVACLGVAVGAGFYFAAGIGTFLVVATVSLLKIFKTKYINPKLNTQIAFQAKNSASKLSEILTEIGVLSGKISHMNFENTDDKWMHVTIMIDKIKDSDISLLAENMADIKGVRDVSIENQ